jgi:hypothetical protein
MMNGIREVGPRHSSNEAGEQSGTACCGPNCSGAESSGAGGAKGGDQGECGPANAPDAELDKRVTGAGTHTESRKGADIVGERRKYLAIASCLQSANCATKNVTFDEGERLKELIFRESA